MITLRQPVRTPILVLLGTVPKAQRYSLDKTLKGCAGYRKHGFKNRNAPSVAVGTCLKQGSVYASAFDLACKPFAFAVALLKIGLHYYLNYAL